MNSTDLLSALDIVAFVRLEHGSFRLLGNAPDWFRCLYPGSILPPGSLHLGEAFPFLENFLSDAEDLWCQSADTCQLASGPWCETGSDGQECHLEALAACLGQRRLLFLQRLGASYARLCRVTESLKPPRLSSSAAYQAALRSSEQS
jgi:hypothetical protein